MLWTRRLFLGAVFAVMLVGCASAPLPKPPSSSSPSPYTRSELGQVDQGSATGLSTPVDFTLTDQFGQQVSLSRYRGKVVLLSFTDDRCTTICPLTDKIQLLAQQALGPAARDVVLLSVNANPEHISVADVKNFSVLHGMMNHWLFLTGSLADLKAVWKAFDIEVQVVKGQIDHTPALYIINQEGVPVRVYVTSPEYGTVPLEADAVAKGLSSVLPSHPSVAKLPPALGAPVSSPASVTSLPTVGGAAVSLPPGSSQVVVFLASWAPGFPQGIAALDAYNAQAAKSGLPKAVAVDVAPIEPSSTSLSGALAALPSPPTFPVAIDRSGRVADAFGVKDMPWITLEKGGKVVWSHDGFLPAATLAQDVQAHLR